MSKKYELIEEETIMIGDYTLHRIRALIDFGYGSAGEVGGYIEKEENLSQYGDAWVGGDACVYGNARVYGNAIVRGNAQVYDNAIIYENAIICDNANVYENATVYDHARIYDRATVCGHAQVCGNASVCNGATVCGNAYISMYTRICDNARCTTDISSNLEESIRVQTGLIPLNGEVIAYKQVRKNLTSFYDPNFKYEVGKIAEAENHDESDRPCASGLHFANANYWNCKEDTETSTFLIARIKLEDIITVQGGKIRCRRAEIIGTYDVKL